MNSHNVLEALDELRKSQSTGEVVELHNPTDETLRILADAAISVEDNVWHQWCHTDTCAHNSHDAGTRIVTVRVPSTYVIRGREAQGRCRRCFSGWQDERDTALFLVPRQEKSPLLVIRRQYGRHFAEGTQLLEVSAVLEGLCR